MEMNRMQQLHLMNEFLYNRQFRRRADKDHIGYLLRTGRKYGQHADRLADQIEQAPRAIRAIRLIGASGKIGHGRIGGQSGNILVGHIAYAEVNLSEISPLRRSRRRRDVRLSVQKLRQAQQRTAANAGPAQMAGVCARARPVRCSAPAAIAENSST